MPKNHHHHIFTPLTIGLILLTFLSFQFIFVNFLAQGQVLGAKLNLNPSEIKALVNLQRQEEGLKPLKSNQLLDDAAMAKAKDMIEFGYWDHFSPTKRPPWKFILDTGYNYHYAGENLAKDFNDNQQLVQAWMDSELHKANILNKNYEDVGLAIIQGQLNDKDTILVVQMFGTPFYLAGDYSNTDGNRITPLEMSAPLLESKAKEADAFVNTNFKASKIMALIVIGILAILLLLDVVKSHRFRQIKNITKHHWGHFIFIFALGIIIIITADGNIL